MGQVFPVPKSEHESEKRKYVLTSTFKIWNVQNASEVNFEVFGTNYLTFYFFKALLVYALHFDNLPVNCSTFIKKNE